MCLLSCCGADFVPNLYVQNRCYVTQKECLYRSRDRHSFVVLQSCSVFKKMFEELIHLLVESFEQSFVQDKSVIVDYQQIDNLVIVIVCKQK
jgi:hypothetical protein